MYELEGEYPELTGVIIPKMYTPQQIRSIFLL